MHIMKKVWLIVINLKNMKESYYFPSYKNKNKDESKNKNIYSHSNQSLFQRYSFLILETVHYSPFCSGIFFFNKSIIIPVLMREYMGGVNWTLSHRDKIREYWYIWTRIHDKNEWNPDWMNTPQTPNMEFCRLISVSTILADSVLIELQRWSWINRCVSLLGRTTESNEHSTWQCWWWWKFRWW